MQYGHDSAAKSGKYCWKNVSSVTEESGLCKDVFQMLRYIYICVCVCMSVYIYIYITGNCLATDVVPILYIFIMLYYLDKILRNGQIING